MEGQEKRERRKESVCKLPEMFRERRELPWHLWRISRPGVRVGSFGDYINLSIYIHNRSI